MKKGIFSLMMGLILAFTGLANAQDVVEVGTGTATYTNGFFNSLWGYSFCETLYPASEIGMAGRITHIAYNVNSTYTSHNEVVVYMKNVSITAFNSVSDVVPVTPADIVYQGPLDFPTTSGWFGFDLDIPFEYDGTSTLMIAFDENNPGYSSRNIYCTTVPNCRWSFYSDTENPDPYNLATFGGRNNVGEEMSNIQITFNGIITYEISLNPNPVDFGARPNNCWMRPMVATVTNEGAYCNIFGVDVDNAYFVPTLADDLAIPFALHRGDSFDVNFSTTSAAEGEVTGQLAIDYQGHRGVTLFDLTAYAYEPVEPDVWEMARVVSNPTEYRDTPTNVTLYDNYLLPPTDVEDGIDAVYKVTFDHDMLLKGDVYQVGTENAAQNAKIAIYTQEGIDAVGGPDLENNYTGPAMGGASSQPYDLVFGDETTSNVTSYYPCYYLYNYSLSESLYRAADLQTAGMGAGAITSIGYNSTSAYGYTVNGVKIWMANVTDTEAGTTSHSTAGMTCVYEGSFNQVQGWNEFALNGSFAWDGSSNLLVVFQMNNGSWDSAISWKYVSTDYVAGFTDFNDNNPYSPETNTYEYYYTHSMLPVTHFVGGGRGGNRVLEVVFSDDFESGSTANWEIVNQGSAGWYIGTDDSHNHHADGSYAMFNNGSGTNRYHYDHMYSPVIDLATATSATLNFDYILPDWSGDINQITVYITDPDHSNSELLARYNTNVTAWKTETFDLSAYCGQRIVVDFVNYNNYGYCGGIDNVVIEADVPAAPGTDPDHLVSMTMLPGTYYIVASSTDDAWDVSLNALEMPCPIDMTAEGNLIAPLDDEEGLDPSAVTLEWQLSPFTTEYRLLFGTTYYCENVLVDWTRNLAESYTVRNLYNNTNYFWRIEERNDGCPEGFQSPVWGFTTTFNAPTNLHATNANGVDIYEGETLHLAWTAIQDRTFRQYNIYMDGELIGSTPANPSPTATTTFDVEGLTYNMGAGYVFNVTALYDEGESAFSNDLVINVSGEGEVDGYVYEQDGVTGIAGATVTKSGTDGYGRTHTYTFTTDANGHYHGTMLAGLYYGVASCAGYQDVAYENNPIDIIYGEVTPDINYVMNEVYTPVGEVIAEYYPDPEDPESPYVKVYWGWNIMSAMIEDFETGDFSQYDWNIPAQYPFEITTNNPYEGTYCMQSTNHNVASSTSSIDVTVEIPRDGLMSFYKRISCESSFDHAEFYVDGAQMATFTGTSGWGVKEVAITAGTHNFKWSYTKDSSVDSGEDRFFIDYIDFIHDPEPVGPGWHTYLEGEFDNAYVSNVGTPSWGYEYPASVISSYVGMTMTKVALFSDDMYGAVGGTFTCNVYQGGATPAAGTLVSTITVNVPSNVGDWVEFDLTTPVHVTNDPLYVLWTADVIGGLGYPAGCATHTSAYGDWWNPGDGSGWSHMGDCTWTMKNYFSDRSGRGFWASNVETNQAIQPMGNLDSNLRTYAKGEEANNGAVCINPNATFKATANGNDRSFQYFRVYRTDCYNDGPYTEENTTVVCCELHDTLYIDVEWPELAPGVYKWGVGCVYGGNRESEISWAAVENKPVENVMAYEPVPASDMEHAMGVRTAPAKFHEIKSNNPFRGSVGYLDNIYGSMIPNGLCKVDMGNPQGATSLNADVSLYAGEIVDGIIYGYTPGGDFVTLDAETGAQLSSTSIGSYMTEMAYDYTTNTMYGCSPNGNTLYTIDLSTGAFTTVGAMTDLSIAVGLVCDLHGQLYAIGRNNGTLYKVDKTTAATTLVGNTGRTPNYFQSAAIDYATNTCYWAYSDASYDDLYTLDLATAQATFVCSFVESCGLCFPYAGAPILPEPTPNEPIQEEHESPIVWSNCLDKDMNLATGEVDITVLLNSADSPEGTTVTFRNYNEAEQDFYPVETVTLDESGYYAWESFRRGVYEVTVTKDGYETITDSVSVMDATNLRYVMIEILNGINDLYVSQTGWAMWEGQGPVPPGPGDEFTEDFEGGLGIFTSIDQDGDGYGWRANTELSGLTGGHNSTNFVLSQSFDNSYGALHPDNYLVSPQVNLISGSTFSFWACAQDESWAAEHFGVFVSDNGTSDWTSVQEWTMTAKGARHDGARGLRQGSWHQYTVDLSAYAGQKYIAVRHFNTTDMYFIDLDDAELTNGAKSGERHLQFYKVLCTSIDGEPIFSGDTPHNFIQLPTETLVEGETYLCKVSAVYSTGYSDWSEVEWMYRSCENYAGAQNIGAEGQTVTWEYPDTPGPVPPGPDGDEWIYDFDNSSMAGWTTIDADGDGKNWMVASSLMSGVAGHNGSADFVFSQSYDNNTGVLYPDNYLVSPLSAITAGSTFSFWACGQDASYAAEHFGVAISTTGNTNASDFTTIYEHTIGAKGARYEGKRGTRDQSAWMQYTVDLSAYAGQQVYIAIRHFNCSDEFYLDVDDIQLSTGAKSNRDAYIQYCTEDLQGGIGTGGGEIWWAIKFPAASLASYVGQSLTKLGIYTDVDGDFGWTYSGNYELSVYAGSTAPTTLLGTTGMQYVAGDLAWHDLDLQAPVAIDGAQDLWIMGHTLNIAYPMSACPYVGDPNSDYLSLDGSTWEHASDYDFANTWMLRGLVVSGNPNPGPGPGPDQPVGEVLGAMIFRDGEWLAEVTYPTSEYTDEEAYGEHEYCVRIIYNGTNVLPYQNVYYSMSCPVCIGGEFTCAAGAPIRGEYVWNNANDFGALISWGEQAEPIAEWLYYDNGVNEDAIGLTAGGSFYWGIMIPSAQLGAYNGCSLTKVSMYDYEAHTGKVIIYQGGSNAPGTPIHQQNYTMTGSMNYVEITLSVALPIDPSQNLWIIFNNDNGQYVAACCSDTGDANGRWISLDGAAWDDVAALGLPDTWQIRGYVTNMAKGTPATAIEAPALNGTPDGVLARAGVSTQGNRPAFANRAAEIVKYNVYRSTDNANYELIGSVDAVEGQTYYEYYDATAAGAYFYQVRALYSNGCESEPAASEANPVNNYVIVLVTSVAENGEIALYPNPTNGNITIQAQNMNRITVVSVLGQVVYDAEVDGDEYHINMAQFNAGVYMVRIATENGVSTQRVTVVK